MSTWTGPDHPVRGHITVSSSVIGAESPRVFVGVEGGRCEARVLEVLPEDRAALAAAVLGVSVHHLHLFDPSERVAVDRKSVHEAAAITGATGLPNLHARLRAALGEGGAR